MEVTPPRSVNIPRPRRAAIWWLAVALVAAPLLPAPAAVPPTAHAAVTPRFVGLPPARLLDTRPTGTTVDGAGRAAGVVGPAASIDVAVSGRGGVPASGVAAVVLNVTVVAPTAVSYITVHPGGTTRPTTSNVNVAPGPPVANSVVVGIGNGSVQLYQHAGTAHLVVDVLGWFPVGGDFTALTPQRLMDTRPNGTTTDGQQVAAGALAGPGTTQVDVLGRGGVPAAGVTAALLNVTAVGPTAGGFVTVFPVGSQRPTASTLNLSPGRTTANMTLVPVGPGGQVSLYLSAGASHLVVDVLGWFTASDAGSALTPARLADTRSGGTTVDGQAVGGGALQAGATMQLTVTGRGGVPGSGVGAVVLNVTAVQPTSTTFVTVFPSNTLRPTASNLNPIAGRTTANLVVVPVGPSGAVSIYLHAGATQVVVDALGWFAGTPSPATVPNIPVARPRIYLPRNAARLQALIAADDPTATRFLDLSATLRSRSYSSLWNSAYSMEQFALVSRLTGDTSYCTFAVNGIEWMVAADEADIAAGRQPGVAGDSYLEVGPMIGDLAIVLDWCYPQTTAPQRARWLAYGDQAVWNVWHPDDAVWGGRPFPWTGWSIDNPANNYYYSFLRATMLLGIAGKGELASADQWLTFFRTTKIAEQLVPTFERDLVGGGSREGTGYGTALMRLWEIYDLWEGTTGENIAALTGHTRASLVHFIHYVVPTLNAVSLNGDHSRDSTGAFFDYHRRFGLQLAKLLPGDPLAAKARWLVDHSSVPEMTSGFMIVEDFLYADLAAMQTPLTGLNTAYYGSGTGQLYARSSWATDAAWLNFTAGPYTESHAHRDQGAFLLYRKDWMAYDPNYHSHSGIQQGEELHNLVRFSPNGGTTIPQREGNTSTLQALQQGPGWVHMAADCTAVYEGAVALDQREIVWLDPGVAIVFDRTTSAANVAQTWQLNTPVQPVINGTTATVTRGTEVMTMRRVISPAVTTSVFDWTTDGDFSGGYRIDERAAGGANTFLHVLSFGTAAAPMVTAVVRSDAGGRQGVQVTFADGRVAIVRFSTTGVNGTLELRAANGTVTQSVVLNAGVRTLPETTG